jgi:hypothetical protein
MSFLYTLHVGWLFDNIVSIASTRISSDVASCLPILHRQSFSSGPSLTDHCMIVHYLSHSP